MNASVRQVERALMSSLARGGAEHERFVLDASGRGAVRIALQASLQTSAAAQELRRLLQLIAALDRLGCSHAAETLRGLIKTDPDAAALVRQTVIDRDADGEEAPLVPAPRSIRESRDEDRLSV